MKKNNAILAGVAAVALAAAMVPAAMAGDAVNGTSAADTTSTTQVKYAVTGGYTWSVPSEIDFGSDKGTNATSVVKADEKVAVTKNVIEDGKTLTITAKGSGDDGAFQVKNGNTKLGYTVKVDDSEQVLTVGGEVLSVPAGTNTKDAALTFTLSTTTGTAEVAGTYSGTVTYTASVK